MWIRTCVFVWLTALGVAATARADSAPDLYAATTIVTGTDLRSRPTGLANCLREVLVKLSGEPRLFNDPRVGTLAVHADTLTVSFSYLDPRAAIRPKDDQGTYDRSQDMTVHFDPARTDRALADLGERPWRGERPEIVPVVTLHGVARPAYQLTAETPLGVEQRASFANSAVKYAMRVRVPSQAELDTWHVALDQAAEVPDATGRQMVVSGSMAFRSTAPIGWDVTWRMRWAGKDVTWHIDGVNYDEAFDHLVRGAMRVASGHDGPE